jgi:hypothetical protein
MPKTFSLLLFLLVKASVFHLFLPSIWTVSQTADAVSLYSPIRQQNIVLCTLILKELVIVSISHACRHSLFYLALCGYSSEHVGRNNYFFKNLLTLSELIGSANSFTNSA